MMADDDVIDPDALAELTEEVDEEEAEEALEGETEE